MSVAVGEVESLLARHLRRMRLLFAIGLAAAPAAAAAALWLGAREPGAATPFTLTLVAYAAALWIGATAAHDARRRLEVAKRGYSVHGELGRLLADHRLVYLAVLLRLEVVALCGLVIAVWGLGPLPAVPVLALAAILVAQTWPTRRKTELLVARAESLRTE